MLFRSERMAAHFAPLGVTKVERHVLPNLCGMNFLLHGVLRRGIRTDAQGKALGEAALAMPLREATVAEPVGEEVSPWVDGLTIGQVLRETATRFPDRLAAFFPERDWRRTWSEFDREVDSVARSLLALGLVRGDHFGLWATNVPEWLLLQFATARIGVVLVTLNPAYRPAELAQALAAADVKALALVDRFKSTDYLAAFAEAVPGLEGCRGGRIACPALPCLGEVVQLRGDTAPWARAWDDFLALGKAVSPEQLAAAMLGVGCDDPVNIQFTSGTTGLPKGATLSHRNILVNAYHAGVNQRLTADDAICVPVPLYHCFGMVMGNLACITHGATIVYPNDGFDPLAVLQRARRVVGHTDITPAHGRHGALLSQKLGNVFGERGDELGFLGVRLVMGEQMPVVFYRGAAAGRIHHNRIQPLTLNLRRPGGDIGACQTHGGIMMAHMMVQGAAAALILGNHHLNSHPVQEPDGCLIDRRGQHLLRAARQCTALAAGGAKPAAR